MKKSLVIISSALLLIGAGCAAKTTLKVNGNSINLDDLEKKVAETKQAPVNDCPIKLASGEPIFNNVDAAAMFGGTWTNEVKIDKKISDDGCIYSLNEDYKAGSESHFIFISTQQKDEFDRLINERNIKRPEFVEVEINGKKIKIKNPHPTFKDITGVGDQALLVILNGKTSNPVLYVKKSNYYVVISPSPATEEQAVSIARTIISRWK